MKKLIAWIKSQFVEQKPDASWLASIDRKIEQCDEQRRMLVDLRAEVRAAINAGVFVNRKTLAAVLPVLRR
jgi:hypothetical protein